MSPLVKLPTNPLFGAVYLPGPVRFCCPLGGLAHHISQDQFALYLAAQSLGGIAMLRAGLPNPSAAFPDPGVPVYKLVAVYVVGLGM